MSSMPERDTLIEELVHQYRKQLQEQLPDDNRTLDQIEGKPAEQHCAAARQVADRLFLYQDVKPPSPFS